MGDTVMQGHENRSACKSDNRAHWKSQAGFSLLAMAFLMIVLGGVVAVGGALYQVWSEQKGSSTTQARMEYIQDALASFAAHHGRYPCPARLTDAFDTANFGVEISDNCATDLTAPAGTTRVASEDATKGFIRIGAVPVRTLNIPDEYVADGYNRRLVYAVTEVYTEDGAPLAEDRGAIRIEDAAGNSATSKPNNIVQVVYSMGWDDNGAYTDNGAIVAACDAGKKSGINCDIADNAVFMNTMEKSSNPSDPFVSRVAYRPSKTVVACEDKGLKIPKDTAFLIDTSGSMASRANGCPAEVGKNCTRMDVAHWAMRRVMPARLYSNTLNKSPGDTIMTGFTNKQWLKDVNPVLSSTWKDRIFDKAPTDGSVYVPPKDDEMMADLEGDLSKMCPSGGTPLGSHMMGLADQIKAHKPEGYVDNPDFPDKITIISDGENNGGEDPMSLLATLKAKHPNIQVDVIDVVGNPSLQKISQETGGAYYRSNNPDELLDALYKSAGICKPYTPATVVDKLYCK